MLQNLFIEGSPLIGIGFLGKNHSIAILFEGLFLFKTISDRSDLQLNFDPIPDNFAEQNMKTRNRLSIVFLLFILYSSLSFSTPLFVECQDVYPDEGLDLFGIPCNSLDFTNTLTASRIASSFSDFIPNGHTIQRYYSGVFYLQPFTSELVLSVTLRC